MKRITSENMGYFTVYANRLDFSKTTVEEGGVEYRLRGYRSHPEYNPKTKANDIAILHLKPTKETRKNMKNLQFIELDSTNGGALANSTQPLKRRPSLHDITNAVEFDNPLNNNMFVAGWGALREGSTKTPNVAHSAKMVLTKETDCRRELNMRLPIETFHCAIGAKGLADACQGDSGGPLFYNDGQRQTLVGVVSFGKGCGEDRSKWLVLRKALPGVYASVYHYRDFIESTTQKFLEAEKSGSGKRPLSTIDAGTPPSTPATKRVRFTRQQFMEALVPALLLRTIMGMSPVSDVNRQSVSFSKPNAGGERATESEEPPATNALSIALNALSNVTNDKN